MRSLRPKHPIRAITLDLDDTLWPVRPTLVAAEQALSDWLAAHTPATAAVLTRERRAEIRARLLDAHPQRAHDLSFVRRESLRLAISEAGEDPALADAGFEVFLAARQQVTLYDDVREVLERWAGRYTLVALSNGNADVRRIGIGAYFAASVSAHEAGFAKPDPRIFRAAARRAGVEPAECLHVGDDWHLDVSAAREAGMQALWLRRPEFAHRPVPDEAPGGVPTAESLAEADRMLHPA